MPRPRKSPEERRAAAARRQREWRARLTPERLAELNARRRERARLNPLTPEQREQRNARTRELEAEWRKAERGERECECCGKPFVPSKRRFTCSPECQAVREKGHRQSWADARRKLGPFWLWRECSECERRFKPRSGPQRTCSKKCAKTRKLRWDRHRYRGGTAEDFFQ